MAVWPGAQASGLSMLFYIACAAGVDIIGRQLLLLGLNDVTETISMYILYFFHFLENCVSDP